MLMPTVNHLQVIECKHKVAKSNKGYKKRRRISAYEGLPIFLYTYISLQNLKTVLALMSHLKMHSALNSRKQ